MTDTTKRICSVEFFPPATEEGAEKLRATRRQLRQLDPAFYSVTYGAGGTTRDRTLEAVLEMKAEGLNAAPHLSCIGSTRDSLRATLARYKSEGIHHMVALRGDLPSGLGDPGDFRYANELVEFVREETGDWFHIEVAAYPEVHPQARNADRDLENFVRKMKAGADSAITQYFYNADAYFAFVDDARAKGVDAPIFPGIMPIANFSKISRFSEACGAEIPRWMRRKFEGFGDDSASIRAYGLDVVTTLCERLLAAGAPGLHFYTLNQAGLTSTIWQRLGL
ncbi:MAG: methylenetetrahydrofolate reductase [NAD(P)H] [Gammaproteobacteria bacterium]|jgi:methylenetetrahydrofolate reductase (NADPH)|nr:methylenetetrahydrofolate reductase [NAD(P)H] [Gammaproteobacteria bacterium]MBU0772212.1 methylenetetrahydrofolate reductase [NAD(P)H] [Gammaproteobacteria bacterium]MBU0855275.1 methylenetetrahydrofolate reductase [NAD(P)H] [Gammaproteobacteria bacterium]MBU1848339.1 methylenetetrahydrofolate reductase [NAD(P)H] [Gammaproteobacteria bacterium]